MSWELSYLSLLTPSQTFVVHWGVQHSPFKGLLRLTFQDSPLVALFCP